MNINLFLLTWNQANPELRSTTSHSLAIFHTHLCWVLTVPDQQPMTVTSVRLPRGRGGHNFVYRIINGIYLALKQPAALSALVCQFTLCLCLSIVCKEYTDISWDHSHRDPSYRQCRRRWTCRGPRPPRGWGRGRGRGPRSAGGRSSSSSRPRPRPPDTPASRCLK